MSVEAADAWHGTRLARWIWRWHHFEWILKGSLTGLDLEFEYPITTNQSCWASMVRQNNTIPSNACADPAACGSTDLEAVAAVAAVAAVVSSGRILKQWFLSSISTSKCCRDWASSSADISGMRWNRIFIFDVRPRCLISRSSSCRNIPSWKFGLHL